MVKKELEKIYTSTDKLIQKHAKLLKMGNTKTSF